MKIDDRFKKQKCKQKKVKINDVPCKNSVLQNAILKISLGEPLTLQESVEYSALTIGFVRMLPRMVKHLKAK